MNAGPPKASMYIWAEIPPAYKAMGSLEFAKKVLEQAEAAYQKIEDQARQVLANLRAVLEAAGSGLDRVVKATVYLTDLGLFPRVNAVYAEAFESEPAPARVTVGVASLPLGAQVEIDAIALAD